MKTLISASLTNADVAFNEHRAIDYTGQVEERFNGRTTNIITQFLNKIRRKFGDRKALKIVGVLETGFQSIIAHITSRYGTYSQPRAFTDVSNASHRTIEANSS